MSDITETTIPVWSGVSAVVGQFDLVIIDLWGVMHDGIRMHHGAVDAVERLRAQGVKTVFLSNAPRPRYHVRHHLESMGMPPSLTDLIVTSGGLARDYVRENGVGQRLYHLGPESDHNTIEGLPVTLVDQAGSADLILATDLDYYHVPDHAEMLRDPARRGVPFLCANPDRTVHVGDRLVPCAGAVADLYEELGGPVHWFGKPMASALQSCAGEAGLNLEALSSERILMIGDNIQTDVAGAHAAGFQSCLIASGIHRDLLMDQIQDGRVSESWFKKAVSNGAPGPSALMPHLVW